MISSQCWLILVLKSGGAENIYFEIWGGRGPPGPPGSSAYVEAAGIPVLTPLRKWATGNIDIASTDHDRPPTWRSLYELLRELDLEELSQEIEEYLSYI